MLSCSSIFTAFHPIPALSPRFCQDAGCFFQKDHQGTANSGSSARCNVANPDPPLSFDGTKLAVNSSMHRAVPKAASLLKQSLL